VKDKITIRYVEESGRSLFEVISLCLKGLTESNKHLWGHSFRLNMETDFPCKIQRFC